LWIDSQARIFNCNPNAQTGLGYTKEEFLSMKIYDVYRNVKEQGWQDFWNKSIKGEPISEISLFKTKESEEISLRTLITAIPYEGEKKCLSMILRKTSVDLTKNTGEKDSQDFLKNIINSVGDPIMVKNEQHQWVLMNDATCAAIGMTWDFLEGKSDYDIFPKEEADEYWEKDNEVITSGKENINEESFTDADGKKSTILTTKRLYKDRFGNKFIVGISKDITEIKEARERMKKINEDLEIKVQERTAELRTANDEMEISIQQLKYLNDKGRFFSQLIDADSLLSAIFQSFVQRFPGGEIHILESYKNLKSIYVTEGLREESIIAGCIDALEFIDWKDLKEMNLEPCWYKNSILSSCFADSLKPKPCYLVIPLITNNNVRGIIQIFTDKEFEHSFDREKTLLNALSTQAAVGLDNAFYYKELGQRTRIQSELEIARGIQKRYVPKEPEIANINLRGVCMPANEVGGDYLDYFQNKHGDWIIVIADVCGKGIPAALVMTSLRSTIRTVGKDSRSSKKLLSEVNGFLGQELQSDNSFITCMCIIINKDGSSMNFSRAGHPNLVAYNSTDNKPAPIPSKGVAVGMIVGDHFVEMLEEVTIPLNKGDRFVAYTDGLDEAMDTEKNFYGLPKLITLLEQSRSENPAEIIKIILADIKVFVKGQKAFDDLTLLAIEKT